MPQHSRAALLSGYHRFRDSHWPEAKAQYEALAADGQKPHTLVVACSDSRADPALIFDAAPGQLFVVRNVANLVPPYEPDGLLHGISAALEFGVKVLNVRRIMVMGHARCGGVAAMLSGAPADCQDFVAPWVQQGAPVVRRVEDGRIHAEANYAVFRTKLDKASTVFNVGRYIDTIVQTPEGLKFAERLCVYDSEMIPNAIIYPI